jgi:hypothetical protein
MTTVYGIDLSKYPTNINDYLNDYLSKNSKAAEPVPSDKLEPGKIYISNTSQLYLCKRPSYNIPSYTIPEYTIPASISVNNGIQNIPEQKILEQKIPIKLEKEILIRLSKYDPYMNEKIILNLYEAEPSNGGGRKRRTKHAAKRARKNRRKTNRRK